MIGSKTMFVRFGGCDYRCVKCDSLHAVIPQAVKKHARRLTTLEIWDELRPVMEATGTKWVTLSGGNPAMWDLSELNELILAWGGYTAVETQGTLRPAWLGNTTLVVTSPKAPGMGEKFNDQVFLDFLLSLAGQTLVALKIVVFSARDIDFAFGVGRGAALLQVIPPGMRFLSVGNDFPPVLNEALDLVDPENKPADLPGHLLANYRMLIEELMTDPRMEDWKILPQTHVLVWGNESEH